jgi:hypothetical protein
MKATPLLLAMPLRTCVALPAAAFDLDKNARIGVSGGYLSAFPADSVAFGLVFSDCVTPQVGMRFLPPLALTFDAFFKFGIAVDDVFAVARLERYRIGDAHDRTSLNLGLGWFAVAYVPPDAEDGRELGAYFKAGWRASAFPPPGRFRILYGMATRSSPTIWKPRFRYAAGRRCW